MTPELSRAPHCERAPITSVRGPVAQVCSTYPAPQITPRFDRAERDRFEMQLSEILVDAIRSRRFRQPPTVGLPRSARAGVSACVEPITRYLTAAVEAVRQSAINNHQETT